MPDLCKNCYPALFDPFTLWRTRTRNSSALILLHYNHDGWGNKNTSLGFSCRCVFYCWRTQKQTSTTSKTTKREVVDQPTKCSHSSNTKFLFLYPSKAWLSVLLHVSPFMLIFSSDMLMKLSRTLIISKKADVSSLPHPSNFLSRSLLWYSSCVLDQPEKHKGARKHPHENLLGRGSSFSTILQPLRRSSW